MNEHEANSPGLLLGTINFEKKKEVSISFGNYILAKYSVSIENLQM